jgi:hypothetical protein
VELIGPDDKSLAQAAIGVNAEDLEVLAAVPALAAAREAIAVVHVWFDRAAIAGANILNGRADFEHFDAELVAGNSRVTEQRELSEVSAGVGAADADTVRADECLVRLKWRRLANLEAFELARCD